MGRIRQSNANHTIVRISDEQIDLVRRYYPEIPDCVPPSKLISILITKHCLANP